MPCEIEQRVCSLGISAKFHTIKKGQCKNQGKGAKCSSFYCKASIFMCNHAIKVLFHLNYFQELLRLHMISQDVLIVGPMESKSCKDVKKDL